jgi:hypothetical protein
LVYFPLYFRARCTIGSSVFRIFQNPHFLLSPYNLQLRARVLKRIELHNPGLNAIVTLMREEALEWARASDEAL